MRALISLHDVMPETLGPTAAVLAALERRRLGPVMLLVVPGRNWKAPDLRRLRRWQAAGHGLAAHGWDHRAARVVGLRHRVHAALLSRHAAQHLALDAGGIEAVMRASHDWFEGRDLRPPRLYVPPAWALGPLPRARLTALPYRWVETLGGVHDVVTGRVDRTPVMGFEADTFPRALALTAGNAVARRCRRVRLAIHPGDPQRRLRRALWRCLDAIEEALPYPGGAEVS